MTNRPETPSTPSRSDARVVLYGVGSTFLADIEASLARAHTAIACYVANVQTTPALERRSIAPADVPQEFRDLACVIALITPGHRETIVDELASFRFMNRPAFLDPTAVVAPSAVIQEGVYVNAGSVIGGEARLERFCTINRAATVGHHSVVEAFAAVGPGVTIPASVTIERGAFVGTGAVLLPNTTVGANAIVGAGAVVVQDVEPHTVVVGNPARVVRRDIVGYNDVGVA